MIVPANNSPTDDWLSPQAILWQQIQMQLMTDGPDFELNIAQTCQQIVEAEEVDDILRFLILEKLLKLGSENSAFVNARAEKPLRTMGLIEISRLTNWVLPSSGNDRTYDYRRSANSYFKNYSSELLEHLQMVMADRAELEQAPLAPANEWVGWLHRDTDGGWVASIRSATASKPGDQLFTIATDPRDGKVKAQQVATYPAAEVTKVKIPDADPTWAEGRLVFRVISDN